MRIVVDVDDVLADTFGAFEDRFGQAADASAENLDTMFPGADVRSVFDDIEFHTEIPPIDGAAAGVDWLIESGHQATYLSSRSPMVEETTRLWLRRWGFPDLPLRCLGRDSKMSSLRSDPYDLLIDDQLRYLTIAKERGIRAIAFANPWNSTWSADRVDGWDELRAVIQR